jgi:uncharacterized membrane protein
MPTTLQAESAPGTTVGFSFSVSNQGNFTDTISLTATSAWTATLSDSSTGPLGAGDTFTFSLQVTIPENAPDGSSEITTVTATSSLDPNLSITGSASAYSVFRRNYLPVIRK